MSGDAWIAGDAYNVDVPLLSLLVSFQDFTTVNFCWCAIRQHYLVFRIIVRRIMSVWLGVIWHWSHCHGSLISFSLCDTFGKIIPLKIYA